ncbi:MAG: DUF1513 domain-containing protein [Pseudomonadota bacterium]
MTSRRRFLAGMTSAAFAPSVSWAAVGNPAALSAAMTPDGIYQLIGLHADGAIAFRTPLPARGHAAAAHPTLAEAVAISRRPGTFSRVIDCVSGRLRQTLEAPEGRHFYGHGAFSSDGALLFTPENDVSSGEGRIGVWDRRLGFSRVDEFSSGGIGPHEILRLPSGDLAVANGGIRTHPSTGREKLNLDTMRPNLAIFSTRGDLRDIAELPASQHRNSLRHIAAREDGTVVCGFQWQGDPFETPSLIALYKGDGTLTPGWLEEDTLRRLDGYIGSVAALKNGLFAASSPRGGRAIIFDNDGAEHATFSALDVCGLSALNAENCLATDGSGAVYALSATDLRPLKRHDIAFDNHLVALH